MMLRFFATHFLLSLTVGTCFANSGDLMLDNTAITSVDGTQNPSNGWKDSYSVGDRCYCDSNGYDHGIGNVLVQTPCGTMTVIAACDLIGPGPGSSGRPVYNDVQCGNGPANNAGDEDPDKCPGRVDNGSSGCGYLGPTWNWNGVSCGPNGPSPTPPAPTPPAPTPTNNGSCGVGDHQGECTSTGQCQNMYSGAYDCKNSEGGVCFCGNNEVCGCIGSTPTPPVPTNPAPTNPAPTNPAPVPAPPTNTGSCGVAAHQGECTTTGQCKNMYSSAYDCKNSEGGVCFCGNNEVCGCL
mmetsp:Transcript_14999/g.24808  ORF Transcript_14999/g.24808 Transcript_14999/m.24808 type:complete len:295 (-) Transcript_14999:417-1301(-)